MRCRHSRSTTGSMREIYNSGKWTQGQFNSFIKSILRAGSRRWGPKYETLNAASVGKRINESSGRLANHFKCASCAGLFPASKVQVDHIEPIIDPVIGFTTWDDVVQRMFCEKENLQVLCLDCHAAKTAAEKQQRKESNATR